ncbi:MAG: oxygen-dependent coproporphyrinogen oxidase [Formosimonas sp.]
MKPNLTKLAAYFSDLQNRIIDGLERLDTIPFKRDAWTKEADSPLQGSGVTAIIEGGSTFERGGVAFSQVSGKALPPSATAHRPELAGRGFSAMGVSLVMHPRNPFVPIVHMNVRCFVALARDDSEEDVMWFGGGMDLTPCYGFIDDCVHFHQTCSDALAPFGDDLYPRFKAWCDEYFYLKHRGEARGVGGIFFDDFAEPDVASAFATMKSVGDAFLAAYVPLVEKHRDDAYDDAHKNWQNYRRGRYVEFNLVFDRGTHFGLQSGGRTESILMSMPPVANWAYQYTPAADSDEMRLLTDFLPTRNWLAT